MVPELEDRQPLLSHLEELRWRLLRSLGWIALGMGVAFQFSGRILAVLIAPVGKVVFLSPVEPFLVHLKVAFLGGLVVSSPLLFWEAWSFLRPAFFPKERRLILVLVPVSAGLFVGGVWFGWKLLLPTALKFLLSFSSESFVPMLTVAHYVGFAGWLIAACGFMFQMPMVVLFLAKLKWVTPRMLLRQWRMSLVGILILSAVLTPTPDMATQLLLAIPMCALYLVSVALSFMVAQ